MVRMRAIRRSERKRSISRTFASIFTISALSATRRPLRSISATRRSASLRIDSFWKSFFNCSRLLTWAAERSSFSRLRRIKAISGRSSLFIVPEPKYSPQRPSHSRNSRPRSSKPCANCWSIAGFVPSNAAAKLGEGTKGSESRNPKSHRLTIGTSSRCLHENYNPKATQYQFLNKALAHVLFSGAKTHVHGSMFKVCFYTFNPRDLFDSRNHVIFKKPGRYDSVH